MKIELRDWRRENQDGTAVIESSNFRITTVDGQIFELKDASAVQPSIGLTGLSVRAQDGTLALRPMSANAVVLTQIPNA